MKTKHWIQLLLLLSIISLGVFAALYKKSKLQDCHLAAKAVVVDKYHRNKRGYSIKYQYSVNEIMYTSSESIKNELARKVSIGDTIDIIYSCDDNNVSEFENLDLYTSEGDY